ncbi:MAG TPA: restriction endonuclease subunit S, partial [Spirochaetota bacterium]|nr:restriction endonuclease subunit S [Spirochaetota bacterium]
MSRNSVPKLRFSEFINEWESNLLGNIFDISAGGDISQENVSQVKNEIFKYPIYANAEKDKGLYGYSDIYRIEENVVTVAGRGVNIGIAHARDHKFYPIVRLLVLKPKQLQDIYFFEYEINRLNLFKESTGVPQLTAPQVSSYEVTFPSLPEQQKIAAFLTTVDEKLQSLKKKKALLEQYKKGVMQKIFSQEIRFLDDNGEEFPEWEEKTLGDVLTIG